MSIRQKMLLALVLLCPLTASAQDRNEEFFAAARKGDAAAVKALLDAGVDVNAKTRYGATALSYACDKGHVEVVLARVGGCVFVLLSAGMGLGLRARPSGPGRPVWLRSVEISVEE